MSDYKSIMCFGDSLTWGWTPVEGGAPSERYPYEQRWSGVLASQLGPKYRIIEEGLNGRTTCLNDPNDDRMNGSEYLPSALASHFPLDLVIIMLGTNDTKPFYNRTPYDICYGMAKLVGQVGASAGGIGTNYPAPKCLVISPPPLAPIPDPFFKGMFEGGYEKSLKLAVEYEGMARFMGVEFFDAGSVIKTEGCDGIHFTAENNRDLGKAVAEKVINIFA